MNVETKTFQNMHFICDSSRLMWVEWSGKGTIR